MNTKQDKKWWVVFSCLQQSLVGANTIFNYGGSLLSSVYREMLSPKQFIGLITTSKLTVKTVQHAGINMYLQLTVAEYCMQLHCDTHHCAPPPSCLIYSELLNRCLFGINALKIKLQNNEMAVCCLVMHTDNYWVHLVPFKSICAFQFECIGPVWSFLSYCTKAKFISNIL